MPSISIPTPRISASPGSVSLGSAPQPPSARESDSQHPPLQVGLRAYVHRNSVASIKDGPFLRNYQNSKSVSLAQELRPPTCNDQLPLKEPLLRPGYSVNMSMTLPAHSRSGKADINIAVIGSAGVGKSTLIQRALGLRTLPSSIASSLRMSVDNVIYTVTLVELDLESFDLVKDRHIHLPKQINGLIVPCMDGALLLYDVMDMDSVAELPQTLNGLLHSALPTILVSCKCDNPENTRQIEVESMEARCSSCIEAVRTAENDSESARLCLSSMLRAIMANRNGQLSASTATPPPPEIRTRRRATLSAHFEPPSDPPRPFSPNSKRSRTSSEFSPLRGSSRGHHHLSRSTKKVQALMSLIPGDQRHEPPLSSHPMFRHDSLAATELGLKFPDVKARPPSSSLGPAEIIDKPYLEMEESDHDSASYRYSDEIPILQRNDDSFSDKPAKVVGVTFNELVERLLNQNMTRADHNFSDIFLCLYRKFAAPGELFDAIIDRLERIADDRYTHYLTRTMTQFRIITVLAKWATNYPGDFANPTTGSKLEAFIAQLAGDPVFAAAAHEMRLQVQSRVLEDDDAGWARTDVDAEHEVGNTEDPSPTSYSIRTRPVTKWDFEREINNFHIDDGSSEEMVRKESREGSSISGPQTWAFQPLSLLFHAVEDYQREAAAMIPKGTLPLTKFRYHTFMDISDEDIADEMTRIDWVMFSSIRLRDLVRHVSLPPEQKEKMTNVNRMINHFNHIAKWVANMILMRDKAKHRAHILEKFMAIALKLRQLNNYNGLAAVLAGINGTAIHRLTQTRNLVPADVQKRFARLVILMGTQKSHFAYRLAWENSPLPRIPFIPLHRRDLVSAEEGSQTFVGTNGERINWKKFEILSEVILPIMKSQTVPYPNLSTHESARELILDCRMPVDDEEVYQRSLQLESSSGSVDIVKKKFPWFQKDKS
ncbi:RasGEF domain-containing protein [Diplocarpon rosae]|nr:RasGEF domain-containing protein [Diplocarpon rosae]